MKQRFFISLCIASVTVGLNFNLLLSNQLSLAKLPNRRSLTGEWVFGFAEGQQQSGANLNKFRGGFTIFYFKQQGNKVNMYDIWGAPGPQGEITQDTIKFPPSYPADEKCLLNSKIIKQGNVILFPEPCESYNNGYAVFIRLGIPSCPRKKDYQQVLKACKIPK